MEEERKVYKVLVEKSKEHHLEDQGSKWILGRLAGRMWSGFTWLRIGTNGKLL
jgi:hypothetical protein